MLRYMAKGTFRCDKIKDLMKETDSILDNPGFSLNKADVITVILVREAEVQKEEKMIPCCL